MTTLLYKVEGAGNDFILGTGGWAERLSGEPELAVRLCDRRLGVGADGVLALGPEVDGRVSLEYRNADGSTALFCANATRCAARAAVELYGSSSWLIVETGWGPIPAEVRGTEVALELPPPGVLPRHLEIETPASVGDLWFVEVGVPHLVAMIEGLADLEFGAVAPPLRRHPALGQEGANLNFYEIDADGVVSVRTWERGVEGETLSCGSGIVAVALHLMARLDMRRMICVPRSGDRLTVEALGDPPGCPTRFTGPARMVAGIEPAEELLRGA